MEKDLSIKILSELTIFTKYAKFLPNYGRKETWSELVKRNRQMHIEKYPELKDEITNVYKFVLDKKILPSMRSMQFAGKPIEISPNRIYNCAYLPMKTWHAFPETMFLLLSGNGVGISVQHHHVEELPSIIKPSEDRKRRFLIGDSIEGWADAIKILMKSYFYGGSTPEFDYRDIRQKGQPLITSGGKAPGPQPLKECILKIKGILDQKNTGQQLSPLEVHDIVCHIADAVLAGGIRRAAIISLFSVNDEEMLSCKFGNWSELNPQRGRANNSAVLLRHKITKDYFMDLWKKIRSSGSGEPGIFFTNDKEYGTNPCCEISLRECSFCNLTEINGSDITTQEEFDERAKAASFIGTLQASYTDFHYLRPIWKRNTERDALIGVGITGVASEKLMALDFEQAAKAVLNENARVAKLIGINKAARTTCIKPSGTSSCVLGTSSGVHAWFDKYYLRRIRIGKIESLYEYLKQNNSEIIADEYFRPHDTAVIEIPQKAPEGAILRSESVYTFLQRIKLLNTKWIHDGHRQGENYNNVSATVFIKEHEWDIVGEWMWENRKYYNGISVLPYDGGSYIQAPFETITEEEFNKRISSLHDINLSNVTEIEDKGLAGELACAGGSCELTRL
jgi:ribonucleoside-diphosphate reductase alpha chain